MSHYIDKMNEVNSLANSKLTVCLIGGGSSSHVLIPFLSTAGHKVNLCTRRPDEWSDIVTCDLTTMEKRVKKRFTGTCKRDSDPSQVVPDADAIILCMPVHQYRSALKRIAPYINKRKRVSRELYLNWEFWRWRFAIIHLEITNVLRSKTGSFCRNDIRSGGIQLDGS